MDMFTPATPESESPDTGHEEFEAADQQSEQYEQQDEHFEEEQHEEVQTEEEETDPDQGHSDTLLAGKYKSPADLENAYLELQRQFTKQRMEQKAAPQTQQQPIQHDDEAVDFNDPYSIIAAINRDPKGTIAQIAQQAYQQARTVETQEQQFNRGIDEVAQTYGDYMKSEQDLDTYFGKVSEVCRDLGISTAKPSPRVLKMAAQELWGDPKAQTNAQVYEQAKRAAREEAEQTRQKKVGLGAPAGAKVQEVPKTEADLIRESIVAASRSGGMFG